MRGATPRTLVVALTLIALAACGDGAGSTVDDPPDSGVKGVVSAGPQCPFEVQGSPCPDQPWQGTVRVTTIDGDMVDEVATGVDGRFEVALEPDDYVVIAVTEADRLPMAAPQEVTIGEGEWVEVTLVVDTGIR